VTYYQREWRLTFRSLPFAGGSNPHIPGTSSFYIKDTKSYSIFKFKPDDVEFIIVPYKFKESGKKLAEKLGCRLKIYETSVRKWPLGWVEIIRKKNWGVR